MHVTEGTAPQNVDTDVRFRTTYYFRVFDYCWAANPALTPASDGGTTVRYRQIIPETDALYRYRMTGKSSALFNQIKFESGTLKKEQIDPFGTDVTFNADINGFLVRDEADAKAEVRAIADARGREADRAAALQRYQALSDLYKQLPESQGESEAVERIKKMKSTLETAMAQALEVYTGVAAQVPELLEAKLDKIAEDIMEVQKRLAADQEQEEGETDAVNARLDAAEATLADLSARLNNDQPRDALCPPGAIQRKGFQLMGPEGIKEFDQDERLIMAMYTGATPLTETLQEYSGRVLNARANPAEQLLPLMRENLRIVEAKNAVERVKVEVTETVEAGPAAAAVFDAALTAFEAR